MELSKTNKEKKLGNINGFSGGNFAGNVYDQDYICPALNSMMGGQRQPMIIVGNDNEKIHKSEASN